MEVKSFSDQIEYMNISAISHDLIRQQAKELDSIFFDFLKRKGISYNETIDGIKKDLFVKNLNIVLFSEKNDVDDLIYTIRVVKVLPISKLEVPMFTQKILIKKPKIITD